MAISQEITESINNSSEIRRMFEEGIKMKEEFGADNVFDFSLGNPDVAPPEAFFSAVKKLIEARQSALHGYMPNIGFVNVRRTVAEKVRKETGVPVTENEIVMACGAAGGINVTLKTILDPDDEVIVIKPFFSEYNFYIRNYRGIPVPVESSPDFSINISNIEKAITARTKAVIINTPNNPTGKVYSQEDIDALAACLSRADHPIYLISDEPYREIVYDGKKIPSVLAAYKNAVIITSYSKTLSLPGERIGYITLNPEISDHDMLMTGLGFCTRVVGFMNAPALMQRTIADIIDETVDINIYARKRDLIVNGLRDAGYEFAVPEGTFYLFFKAPGGDDKAYVSHLKKYNILSVSGTGFGGPGYIRLAFCVSEKTIINSLPGFKKALEDFRKL